MRINTRTGSLDLTKDEHKTLAKAKALLLAIAKHAEGDLADEADLTADRLGNVTSFFEGVPEAAGATA